MKERPYETTWDIVSEAIESLTKALANEKGEVDPEVRSEVLWTFIRTWDLRETSPYLKLLDFEALLYPPASDDTKDYYNQSLPKFAADDIMWRVTTALEADAKGEITLTPMMKEHFQNIKDNGLPYGCYILE